jgi:hypothetical protein
MSTERLLSFATSQTSLTIVTEYGTSQCEIQIRQRPRGPIRSRHECKGSLGVADKIVSTVACFRLRHRGCSAAARPISPIPNSDIVPASGTLVSVLVATKMVAE